MDEEFHDWAMNKNLVLGSTAYYTAKQAWIEATRRADSKIKELEEKLQGAEHAIKDILIELYSADRKARLECAEICDKLKAAGAWEAADAIRATIPEE